jgi:hypothetical protein
MRAIRVLAILAFIPAAAAAAPGAPPADAAAPPLTDLPDGHYWVRRVVREQFVRSEGYGADGTGGGIWTKLSTECQRLDLETEGRRRRLHVGDLTFLISPAPRGWTLTHPVLSSQRPPLELPGQCQATLDVAGAPIYRDRDACQDVASVTRFCRRGVCQYEGEAPFVIADCEKTLAAMAADAALITGAAHADSMRSVQRLDRIARAGGKLWADEPEEDRCHPITVTPRPGGAVALRQSFARRDGGRMTYQAQVALEPLFHTARYDSESRWYEGPPGTGFGGYGSGGPYTGGLYAGKDVVLLGNRWLYFDRARCEARHRPFVRVRAGRSARTSPR